MKFETVVLTSLLLAVGIMILLVLASPYLPVPTDGDRETQLYTDINAIRTEHNQPTLMRYTIDPEYGMTYTGYLENYPTSPHEISYHILSNHDPADFLIPATGIYLIVTTHGSRTDYTITLA